MAKMKIDKELLKKVKQYAKIAGYASEEEFVIHALEKEISRMEEAESGDEIKKKLQGLGYIS
jgi:metal-responsive CopG/Arc/MetJ family transcriptional regulator